MRFELLAYIDAETGRNPATREPNTVSVNVADLAVKLGANHRTVRRHLDWLADHDWIRFTGRGRTHAGAGRGERRDTVAVNYDHRVGGVTVEEWMNLGQWVWLRPGRLVDKNEMKQAKNRRRRPF